MSIKDKTSGLFYPLALFSVGIFLFVLGLMPGPHPHLREEFEGIEGYLTDDANNVGPRFRTFFINTLPGVRLYLDDVYLGSSKGAKFADMMEAGAKVEVHLLKKDLSDWKDGSQDFIDVHGLVVEGDTLVSIDKVVKDQPELFRDRRISFIVVGGVLMLGGVIFGMARMRAKKSRSGS